MSKKRAKRSSPSSLAKPAGGASRGGAMAGLGLLVVVMAALGGVWWRHSQKDKKDGKEQNGPSAVAAAEVYTPRPKGSITFNEEIAPIVFSRCAVCHRPGQPAPFSLLTYAEVKKRAREIAQVTEQRTMPPWPPEAGYGHFRDERRLSAVELGLIQQWVAEGAVEGSAADLPAPPKWTDGWILGKPDVVVTMPQPYLLAANGKDVYRHFVIPLPENAVGYVKAVEFNPGNFQAVHHAFIKVDKTRESRQADAKDAEPGFGGMAGSSAMPDGHMLGWQPGRLPASPDEGLAWKLEANTDIVLQLHMRTTGKPESVQPSVALYFSEHPPTNTTFKFALRSLSLNIPAGETNYVVEDQMTLPVDSRISAILPHAHFLARSVDGWAVRPDGSQEWLLRIKDWDFNWQGDYRYAQPVELPKGTKLFMRWVYDNSTNNVRNPFNPPQRVIYGPESLDEMCELWFQFLPKGTSDLAALRQSVEAYGAGVWRSHFDHALRLNPEDAVTHSDLGLMLFGQRAYPQAYEHLRRAVELKPDYEVGHYNLGLWYRSQKRFNEALLEFETVLRLNPQNNRALGNLGLMSIERGDLDSAERYLRAALAANPEDPLAAETLTKVIRAREKR